MANDRKMNKEYRKLLVRKCSMFKIGILKFESRGFNDGGIYCLFVDNREAGNYDDFQTSKLQTKKAHKISKITAVNSTKAKNI